ncbi:MAG: DUF3854 domain-containing protein [Armatimonadota bacterium]
MDLLGVWNFRGRNEYDGKTVLADWEKIALNGRRVFIVFDSDVVTKKEVGGALRRLKAFLDSRGAMVQVIYLPSTEDGKKVGLDDYLAAGNSTDTLFNLASDTIPDVDSESSVTCPYRATPTGMVYLKPTNHGELEVPLSNFNAKVVAEICRDDGAETERSFEIEADMNGRTRKVAVPAAQFSNMNWTIENLGITSVVYPGFGNKDHARTAIQMLSTDVTSRVVFTHTGWRELEGTNIYLHAGGGIGPEGKVEGVEVDLPRALSNFVLPEPATGEDLVNGICACMRVLGLAPLHVTVPLFAGAFRVPISDVDFSLYLSGPTGAGKTELAALMQQHWGSGLDARHMPGSWSSTGNAMEGIAFLAKDALLVVDDFAPAGSTSDIARLNRDADRIFRGQGNRSGRLRMRADSTLRPSKAPRGLILSTGEDIPRGHSVRARLMVVELEPGALDFDKLTDCQRDAASGVYAKVLSAYLMWLAGQLDQIQDELRAYVVNRQGTFCSDQLHRRTVSMICNLEMGLACFLRFAVEKGALTHDEASVLQRSWSAALEEAAYRQSNHQRAEDPVLGFVELIHAALASGRAHIASATGGEPGNAMIWGWQQGVGSSMSDTGYRPRGARIGWVDGEDVYLEPQAAFAVAQGMARDSGDTIPLRGKTLHKRLDEHGLLASTDTARSTLTVRRTLEGSRRNVLHLHRSSIVPPPDDAEGEQPSELDIWSA